MKNEIENSMRGLSFLCRLRDIKNAWINPQQGMLILMLIDVQYLQKVVFSCEDFLQISQLTITLRGNYIWQINKRANMEHGRKPRK